MSNLRQAKAIARAITAIDSVRLEDGTEDLTTARKSLFEALLVRGYCFKEMNHEAIRKIRTSETELQRDRQAIINKGCTTA